MSLTQEEFKEQDFFQAAKTSDNPVIRWWNGHYITGLELKNQVME